MLQTKVIQKKIFYKKVTGQVSLISSRSEGKGFQRFAIFEKIIMHQNGKVGSLQGRMLLKLPMIQKNVLNSSCAELNIIQKKVSGRVSLSPSGVELPGLSRYLHQRSTFLINVADLLARFLLHRLFLSWISLYFGFRDNI